MNAKLTDADEIEVESFYDGGAGQTREDKLEVGRWSKKGDRLYINSGISKADKYSLYVDLETHEIVSDNTSKHGGGSVEIDGDTAEVEIIEKDKVRGDKTHVITVHLHGEAFEADDDAEADTDESADDQDTDDEPVVMTDGGQDTATGPMDTLAALAGEGRVPVDDLSHRDDPRLHIGTPEGEIQTGRQPDRVRTEGSAKQRRWQWGDYQLEEERDGHPDLDADQRHAVVVTHIDE